ncbi:ligase-associated DNA damage response endonuclease PdeM [Leisingera sp. HS039]|uniref:ligase-associated DNA damage response endonuclease PdeM n=1 Tax=unclassified Leisingera TaxID=2614906 RepID=UPI001070BA54|nr:MULTISPECIES: ligase-associated DNA damage response endonuclease PdeM [unclassified Leisingera]MBQ4824113.1 ligase-associated DNA damage response endonuclease PdeM [Leisingera sp. HS039]QBR35516.1 ligase-associated DNA damage response endonuclease PdeM [Leisingera sp. NJS201]
MNGFDFNLAGTRLTALGSGALWWADHRLLCVSDLHLGKSARHARRGGSALPPYEGRDTLNRLEGLVADLNPATVVCLGDSFDDDTAATELPATERIQTLDLMQNRRWIWIEGNHDPAPTSLGGEHLADLRVGPLTFRHIADPPATAEVSGHYHPKARVRSNSRPCFLLDASRLILPAFGTYTGGLRSSDPALASLMAPNALAILTGPQALPIPMPR